MGKYKYNPLLPANLQEKGDGGGPGAISTVNGQTGAVTVAGGLVIDAVPLYYADNKVKQTIYALKADLTKKIESRFAYPAGQVIAEINDLIEGFFIRTTYTYTAGQITAVSKENITSFSIAL